MGVGRSIKRAMENDMAETPPLSTEAKAFQPGRYKHYKGGLYRAFFVARSSEARDQEFVVYESLDKGFIWVRPLGMFMEEVEIDGQRKPRFERIGD